MNATSTTQPDPEVPAIVFGPVTWLLLGALFRADREGSSVTAGAP